MKRNLALFPLSILILAFNCFAQSSETPVSQVKTAYAAWLSSHGSQIDGQSAFFAVEAERLDSTSATVTAGIAAFGRGFTLTLTPLKSEKNRDGKFVETPFAVAARIGTGPTEDRETLATPTLTFNVPAEANAIKVTLQRGDSSSTIETTISLNGKTRSQIASK